MVLTSPLYPGRVYVGSAFCTFVHGLELICGHGASFSVTISPGRRSASSIWLIALSEAALHPVRPHHVFSVSVPRASPTHSSDPAAAWLQHDSVTWCYLALLVQWAWCQPFLQVLSWPAPTNRGLWLPAGCHTGTHRAELATGRLGVGLDPQTLVGRPHSGAWSEMR